MKKFIIKYSRQLFITAGILIYVSLFMVYYPPIYAIQDEADYFDFAYRLKERAIYFDPLTAHKVVFNGKAYVDMYTPGMPILLLPFAIIHYKGLFLLNMLLHIAGFIFFVKSLKLLKVDIRYSLLYLFYPSFVLYSRTVMPDIAIGSLISLAVYFYLKDKTINKFISGIIFGYLVLIKNVMLIVPFTFFLCMLGMYFIKQSRYFRINIINFLLGLSLFTSLAIVYNLIAFKNIISTAIAGGGTLSIGYLPSHFIFYFIFLILFYPLMFFAPLLYKEKNKAEFACSTLAFIIFISMWSFIQPAKGFLKNMLVGSRYLLAVMPIYMLTYCEFLNRNFGRIKEELKRLILIIVLLILTFGAYIINSGHQEYLKDQLHYKDVLYGNTRDGAFIVCNPETLELLQKAWGRRKWMPFANPLLEQQLNSITEFYIVAFLRKDKPEEFTNDVYMLDVLVKRYNAGLIKKIDEPYQLLIYKVKK